MKLELKQILAPKVFYGHTIDLVVTPYAPDFVFKVISVTINESVKITRRKKRKADCQKYYIQTMCWTHETNANLINKIIIISGSKLKCISCFSGGLYMYPVPYNKGKLYDKSRSSMHVIN